MAQVSDSAWFPDRHHTSKIAWQVRQAFNLKWDAAGSEASFFERLGGGYLLENVDVRHWNLRLPIQTLSKSEVSTVCQ